MSIYGTMKTAVSGMNAQANRLSTVGDNIANVNTTAYKRVTTAFSSFVLPSTSGNYNSGGVTTKTINSISEQGALTSTSSDTDLAINGDGFFVVQDTGGRNFLTRVGNFTLDNEGYLVNAAGFKLMGSATIGAEINDFTQLEPIKIQAYRLTAVPTTTASGSTNLDKTAPLYNVNADGTPKTGATLPSANTATASYALKTSLTTYDSSGTQIIYDIYYAKTADNEWEVSFYNKADADATTGGFPYASGPVKKADLEFDPTTFNLKSVDGDQDNLTLDVDGVEVNLSKTTQLNSASISKLARDNGSAPTSLQGLTVDTDGVVYAVYESGAMLSLAQLSLATVVSPNNLELGSGNVYSVTADSGAPVFGLPGQPGFGTVISGALETSNVDLASELTEMIESQRSYTANSKVFQTGADVLDVLINLKR